MGGFAWVTLATNDSYSLGAMVLAHSLKRVNTAHQLVVLITPGVSEAMRTQLSAVFNVVKVVDVLDSKDEANLTLLARPELGVTFTKLHCWRLTQFDKCVFLDADTLVIQNCDELFEREEFSAAPDPGWPDCFNSGVFVYKPSNETFKSIMEFAVIHGSFDGGDQGLLNSYFHDWSSKDISKHLPFVYNMCSTATYSYLPAFKQFKDGLKIIHFIGPAKPWLQPFDTETGLARVSGDAQNIGTFVQMWWDLFCTYVHPHLSTEMAGLAGALSTVTLGAPLSEEQNALQEHLRRQGWEQGNIDYMGRDSFDNIWQKICETLANAGAAKEEPTQPKPSEPKSPVPQAPVIVPSTDSVSIEPPKHTSAPPAPVPSPAPASVEPSIPSPAPPASPPAPVLSPSPVSVEPPTPLTAPPASPPAPVPSPSPVSVEPITPLTAPPASPPAPIPSPSPASVEPPKPLSAPSASSPAPVPDTFKTVAPKTPPATSPAVVPPSPPSSKPGTPVKSPSTPPAESQTKPTLPPQPSLPLSPPQSPPQAQSKPTAPSQSPFSTKTPPKTPPTSPPQTPSKTSVTSQPSTPTVTSPTPPTSPHTISPLDAALAAKLKVETEIPETPPVGATSGLEQAAGEPPVPPKRKGGSKGSVSQESSSKPQQQKGGKPSKGKK